MTDPTSHSTTRPRARARRSRNHDRAQRARIAVNAYVCEHKQTDAPRYDEEPFSVILVDLLTDLMHHCRQEEPDAPFEACLDLARSHFRAETDKAGKRPGPRPQA